jgi:hypothetical protein
MSNYSQLKQWSLKMSLKKPYLLSTLMLLASPIQAGDLDPASDPQRTSSGTLQIQSTDTKESLCIPPATLSAGKRWCDKNDGTVMDMTTGLIWLQVANFGAGNWDHAITQAGILSVNTDFQLGDGTDVKPSDGSVVGDWHLPTNTELVGITIGTEPVSTGNPRAFSHVEKIYWTFTSSQEQHERAFHVHLEDGRVASEGKTDGNDFIWPVRIGQYSVPE